MFYAVESLYGKKTALSVADFFNNICLPIPQNLFQCTPTNDDGFIVFINPAACIIRLTSNEKFPPIDHPNILQPLFKRNCGAIRAEIFPGVASPIRSTEIEWLGKALWDDRIRLFDDFFHNGGYLPVKTDECPNGIPVVIDMGACDKLNDSVQKAKEILQKPSAQSEVFKPLTCAFSKAWPENAATSNQNELARAWSLCAQYKEQKILIDNWNSENMPPNYKNAKSGSAAYHALLEKHPTSSAIFERPAPN